jgi:hypothetical protein
MHQTLDPLAIDRFSGPFQDRRHPPHQPQVLVRLDGRRGVVGRAVEAEQFTLMNDAQFRVIWLDETRLASTAAGNAFFQPRDFHVKPADPLVELGLDDLAGVVIAMSAVLEERRVAPQGTVVMPGLARGPELASADALAVWGRPRAAAGSVGSTTRASSTRGPSAPPPSPVFEPTT